MPNSLLLHAPGEDTLSGSAKVERIVLTEDILWRIRGRTFSNVYVSPGAAHLIATERDTYVGVGRALAIAVASSGGRVVWR